MGKRFGGDERPKLEHLSFEIAAWPRDDDGAVDGDPIWHEFHAYGRIPAGAVFNLASHTDAQGRTDGGAALDFFTRAIVADELDEWTRVINDPDTLVVAEDLGEVARWLNGIYFPPTRPSRRERRASPGGRSSTGQTSQLEPAEPAYS